MTDFNFTSYTELTDELNAGRELAIVDVRDKADYVSGHLWRAINIPYSRLEVCVNRFIPRLNTQIILCHAADSLFKRAAASLLRIGYTNITRFSEHSDKMQTPDYPVITGDYCIAHCFGYHIESYYKTPVITPAQLGKKINDDENVLVIDTRSPDDYQRSSLPMSISIPVEEVVQKVPDLITNECTQIVVHCAGITRAALGAQTLINSGIPNPVKLLRDGTKGWFLDGQRLQPGSNFFKSKPSGAASQFSLKTANELANQFSLKYWAPDTLNKWVDTHFDRTCYLIDVRSRSEYSQGHFPGAINIAGGELAGMTSDHLAICNARLCLIDDGESARAEVTASWMLQLGWIEVVILKDWIESSEYNVDHQTQRKSEPRLSESQILSATQLKQMLNRQDVAVIDFSHSREYEAQHIPGAFWALRSSILESMSQLQDYRSLVITSYHGQIAKFIASEIESETNKNVFWLKGGNDAWVTQGFEMSNGMNHPLSLVKDNDPSLTQDKQASENAVKAQYRESINHRNSLYEKFIRDNPLAFRSPNHCCD